ncbi:acetyl-CoA hydrolase/transferase C-terminal domain-containing protein [Flammeovirgaceae bacterium SG7u.111]|nr:acetyl-CoA hydrolase/transferase C-terminal domain-containing protein [Flammeovirgaceae bacterium SG7u.132]WPO37939.1 acetyl-CoA hydrolase/transferase C-terminal domain-containing protein [Flammeovirgaceae bacterium SG7u.111]
MRRSYKQPKYTSPQEAVSVINSYERVFVHSVSMTPGKLVEAMVNRASELKEVEIIHIHTEGPAPYAAPEYAGSFRHNACFVGANVRKFVQSGYADYIPVFLSDVPRLFKRGILPIDVAMITVTPPDKHGYCSLGSSVDVTLAALETAKVIIAEINPNAPRSLGDGVIHISQIDMAVEVDYPIFTIPRREPSEEEQKMGKLIAELIEDGSTLQMGIGGVPDAVLSQLGNHKGLGIHTEMFSDGLIDLVEKGIVTNEHKKVLPHKVCTCFVMGTQKVYDFLDDNPVIAMKDSSFTNDTAIIRKNPKVTAINSAVEVDLTGQVCADTIGSKQYSGVGGQMDFIRGAALSQNGKPIIALSSQTNKGISKIVPFLKEGAGVTTTRAHVQYVVTEFGVANLFGKNLRQRAKELIRIAHPDHQEYLEKMAFERFGQL